MEICIICVLIENVSDVRIANIVKKERNIYIKKKIKKEKKTCVNIVLQVT